MAQEERLLILQMVADKKITAAEGVELLRALDAKDAVPGAGLTQGVPAAPAASAPQAAPRPQVSGVTFHMAPTPATPPLPPVPPMHAGHSTPPPGAPAVQPVPPIEPVAPHQPHAGNLGSGLASFIEDIVEKVSSAFSEVVEPRYEFTYELTGEFPADGVVPLRIQTGNGKALIQTWDEPGWKAVILVKARGNNEEDARSRARDAYSVKSTTGFELEARRHDWTDLAVNVTLYVPRGLKYSVDTRTGNGRVEVHGIDITDGRITTGNGHLVCNASTAEHLALRSGNGAVEIEGDILLVEAETGNGSMKVRPRGARSQNFRLHTGNGSIRVDTATLPAEVGFKVEAHTGMGGINLSMPGLIYDRDIRTVGHKHIVGRTANYEQAAVKVTIAAKTGMGSVTVG
ncbi:MAG: hypothetical protein K0R39_1592 [Symbiobacteriaceae bacterium]|jgi:DUF4097 and DUF4098 domain-containing protein YvlB|nr:hypothetical protein [Symbiobacteriaceae bacterium]